MAYSVPADLLLDDTIYSVDVQKFIDLAAEEIDVRLGELYQLPLAPIPPALTLPVRDLTLLKIINNKLATGQIILAAATPGEDNNLHAYGRWLVNDAWATLMLIANDELKLSAIRLEGLTEEDTSRLPATVNHDEESLLLGFENTVLRGEGWYSRPGAA